jgi:hypothetical protein
VNETEVHTIIDCLPKGKTRFYYFKDRYAQMLLSYYAGSGLPVYQIKKTNYGKLLKKQLIKSLIEKSGSDLVTSALVNSVWPRSYECYLLTLGTWGQNTRWIRSFYQTTRSGYNLVLQLNFSAKHNRSYYQTVQPNERHPFEYDSHPIAGDGYHTLAWSRLDINLGQGEALIEEIQNDWIRDALWMKRQIEHDLERKSAKPWKETYWGQELGCQPEDIIMYVEHVLNDHIQLWDEAILAATIWFLHEELGIRTIYYHTFETGNKLKKMNLAYARPPRSLYTSLPRKFCFEKTHTFPEWFLRDNCKRTRSLKKMGELVFWRLML